MIDSVEIEVKSESYFTTICVVDRESFIKGRRFFPCADGNDYKIKDNDIFLCLDSFGCELPDIYKQDNIDNCCYKIEGYIDVSPKLTPEEAFNKAKKEVLTHLSNSAYYEVKKITFENYCLYIKRYYSSKHWFNQRVNKKN